MKEILGTLAIMLFCIIATMAQDRSTETFAFRPKRNKPLKPESPKQTFTTNYHYIPSSVAPISVQVLAGSQGVGLDVKYGFLPKLSARAGFGIIPVDADKAFRFSGFKVDGLFSSRFSNMHLLADYSPFRTQNLRLVGGAAYLVRGDAKAVITPTDGYSIGSRKLDRDDIGAIHADVNWRGVAPYLGLSLLKSFPNRLFNINLDLGTYYLSSPRTSFTGTKMLAENDANAVQFNKNMSGYQWLPVVQVNFNFRIQ